MLSSVWHIIDSFENDTFYIKALWLKKECRAILRGTPLLLCLLQYYLMTNAFNLGRERGIQKKKKKTFSKRTESKQLFCASDTLGIKCVSKTSQTSHWWLIIHYLYIDITCWVFYSGSSSKRLPFLWNKYCLRNIISAR